MNRLVPGGSARQVEGSTALPLWVHADLSIDVDGTRAQLTSAGTRLTLRSTHPERIWAAAIAAVVPPPGAGAPGGARPLARLAAELANAGLRLEIIGPQGSVVHLGRGVRSRLGQLVTGSSAVAAGTPAAVAVMLWRRSPRVATVAAGLLSAAAITAGAVRVGRRHR